MFKKTLGALPSAIDYVATLRRILALMWQTSPWLFSGLVVLVVVSSLSPLATITLNAIILETLVGIVNADQLMGLPNQIIYWLGLLGIVIVLSQVLKRVQLAVLELYQLRVRNHIQLLISQHAARLDFASFEDPAFYNQLTNATQEVATRPIQITQGFTQLISTSTIIISIGVVVIIWQWWILPIIVITALTVFFTQKRLMRESFLLVLGQTTVQRQAEYMQSLLTNHASAKEVRLFGLGPLFSERLQQFLQTLYTQQRQLTQKHIFIGGAVDGSTAVVSPLLIGYAAFQVVRGTISIGQFSLYTQAIVQLSTNVMMAIHTLAMLHQCNLFVSLLFRLLDRQPEIEAPLSATSQYALSHCKPPFIEFRNVSFAYPHTTRKVIQNVSFEIHPGEALALVGENGAGKTTIVKLLTRLYYPTEGRILINGEDITQLDPTALRQLLSVVFQDFTIYHFSAYDNIGIGNLDYIHNHQRIEASAQQSGFDHVARSLPHAYHTVLGRMFDKGTELSGGQRQLVALSRALMRDAPVMILDEPSAALDIRTETHFFDTLGTHTKSSGQSVIFVSHRLSTVRRADRILVLEHGQLVEVGSHNELMSLRRRYYELFTLQTSLYIDHSSDTINKTNRMRQYDNKQ